MPTFAPTCTTYFSLSTYRNNNLTIAKLYLDVLISFDIPSSYASTNISNSFFIFYIFVYIYICTNTVLLLLLGIHSLQLLILVYYDFIICMIVIITYINISYMLLLYIYNICYYYLTYNISIQ